MTTLSRTLSITEARKRIFEIASEVRPGVHFTLTEKGHSRIVVMSSEEHEGWMETLDIMAEDPDALKAIRRARANFEKGNYSTLEELKKKYGIQSHPGRKRRKRTR
jgi:PHD/YefM family antitoxin component YafN of YafNO toxin-antitoxin module